MTTTKHIYADFGNSRAKLLLPDNNVVFLNYDTRFESRITKLSQNIELFIFSSVNKDATSRLKTVLNPMQVTDSSELLKKQKIIDYSDISGMGTDRILGMIGGLSIFDPPLITVDFGTAVTINALDRNSKVIGGMIFPGLFLQESSLRNGTSKLKKFIFNSPATLLGKNTSEAISSGIYHEIAYAVSGVVNAVIDTYFKKEKLNIFLTGGYLSLILPLLNMSHPVVREDFLVLKGLKFLVES